MLGRVSLNPLRHVDPIGTIAVPLLLYFLTGGQFVFGYAKPVPVAFDRLRNPRWHGMWVALAGPGSNVAQAFLWALMALGLLMAHVQEPFFVEMARAGVLVNWSWRPSTCSRSAAGRRLRADRAAAAAYRLRGRAHRTHGIFIVLALVAAGVITQVWMRPVVQPAQLAGRADAAAAARLDPLMY